ncbi:MAG: hypothetical protein AAGU27_07820 [Dehalobacterium sp.]
MQKKICFILLGYIIVLSIIGISFYVYKKFASLPVIEEALIEEIATSISKEDIMRYNRNNENKEDVSQDPQDIPPEHSGSDYWENYHQENTGITDTEEIISRLKNTEISTEDKLKVLSILRRNLTTEEIKSIVSKMKNGFTADEKSEVKALLLRKLSNDAQNELKDIVLKYL